MVRRRAAGYTLLEVVVAMAVFGLFLAILSVLTVEMRAQEKRLPVNFLRHPQVIVVVSKLRRDVQDAIGSNPYLPEFTSNNDKYTQGKQTLIFTTHSKETGGSQTIVWDFRTAGEVTRRAYNVGVPTTWKSRGLPESFEIGSVEFIGRPYGVRIQARDGKGRLAIDQILQPRAHQ